MKYFVYDDPTCAFTSRQIQSQYIQMCGLMFMIIGLQHIGYMVIL